MSCDTPEAEQAALEKIEALAGELPRHQPSDEVLLRITKAIAQTTAPPRRTEFGPVLDLDELADYLRLDKEALGEYVDDIPSFELGGKLLFRRKRVEEWIEKRELGPGYFLREPVRESVATARLARLGGSRWNM